MPRIYWSINQPGASGVSPFTVASLQLLSCQTRSLFSYRLHNEKQAQGRELAEESINCVCVYVYVVYRLNTFVIKKKKRREKLYKSIGQAEKRPPKSESLQLNRCLMHLWQITPRIFPAVADIWLFICLEKKAWADETRGLKEAENGSIMSVGRLTYDILERPVSREAKTACLPKMKNPTHTLERQQVCHKSKTYLNDLFFSCGMFK